MSFSAESGNASGVPIARLEYCDIASHLLAVDEVRTASRGAGKESNHTAELECSRDECEKLIEQAKAESILATERRLGDVYEKQLGEARTALIEAAVDFEGKRCDYFARVEVEVVQLALAISAKILHREAQVDPKLLAALVKIAIEKLRDGSNVTLRVGPGCAGKWQQHLEGSHVGHFEVLEDELLSRYDCVLQTELGDTNLGLDAQLKEVEQGFFDLLALKPERR